MKRTGAAGDIAVLFFEQQEAWAAWLAKNHASSPGVWMRLAKKASGIPSMAYNEALDAALCYGWIDGQKKSSGENFWLQKFTPRAKKSIWSKINRQKALGLIEGGQMKPAGLAEIERAQQDAAGRQPTTPGAVRPCRVICRRHWIATRARRLFLRPSTGRTGTPSFSEFKRPRRRRRA